jgi:hypothetical protein
LKSILEQVSELNESDDLVAPLGDGKFSYISTENIAILRKALSVTIKIAKAAEKHVNYAKEKRDCGPCFEYCPNAINGDLSCECGGSALWSSIGALKKSETSMTYEEKKAQLIARKTSLALDSRGDGLWLANELEKAWEALEWYADVDNTIVVHASFNDQRDSAHIWVGKKAKEALGL